MISRCAPRSIDRDSLSLVRAGLRGAKLWIPILILLLAAGCSHPAVQGDTAARPNPHPVPFHEAASTASTVLSDSAAPSKVETGLPFHDVESLPVGTLLTVRLNSLVSADHPGPGNTFEAVLDEAIKIDGSVVIPKGSTVSGHVESAQISKVRKNRGYIRLDLQSIDVGGRDLPLQTASLFTRGTAHLILADGGRISSNVTTLDKGRRLTFRLTEPVYVAAQRAVSPQ